MVSWKKRVEALIRHQFRLKQKNISKKTTSRSDRIIEQIRFYFSDANLARDKYMQNLFANDPFGWLEIKLLITFPILKYLQVNESEVIQFLCKDDFFLFDLPNGRIRRNFILFPNLHVEQILASKSASAPSQMSLIERRTVCIDKVPVLLTRTEIKDALLAQFPFIQIQHVSVPRHTVTGENLGTIFVLLGSESEAKTVIRDLKQFPDHEDRILFRDEKDYVTAMTMAKFNALKAEYKAAKSLKVINRHEYFIAYKTDEDLIRDTLDEPPDSSVSSTSSSSVVSDINSLAQDSLHVRRSCNASTIRSDTIVLITNVSLPPLQLRIWLSHFSAIQFLDFHPETYSCHVRLSSKRERDFFLKDSKRCDNKGMTLRALDPEECLAYFETERQRRRDSKAVSVHVDHVEESKQITTIPKIAKGKTHAACFTDIIAGNPGTREAGTSILRGIKKGRHIAREFFRSYLDPLPTDPLRAPKRSLENSSGPPTKIARTEKKPTRRGKRGGKPR